MARLLRSTRTWNPMMWTSFMGMSVAILVGADNSTIGGAVVMLIAACAVAFLMAAAIVATFSN